MRSLERGNHARYVYIRLSFISRQRLSNTWTRHWRWNKMYYLVMDRVKRIWYLSHMRVAKVQASLRIRAVSPEPSLLAHTSSESRGTFRQKARSLASLNGWACTVKICHDGMLEDTNSLDGAHISSNVLVDCCMHETHVYLNESKWCIMKAHIRFTKI